VRILSNAGGLNPLACRERIFEVARELGVPASASPWSRATTCCRASPSWSPPGTSWPTWTPASRSRPVVARMTSANAYLGARPVVQALAEGADIVLCGRITDTALALAPDPRVRLGPDDDWDRLAAGTIAGHILECGAQCTGGNFSRWWEVPDLAGVGYPIVEAREDGTFVVTKHRAPAAWSTVDTVAEQLLYEMATRRTTSRRTWSPTSPRSTSKPEGENRVRVHGIHGRARHRVLQGQRCLLRRLERRRLRSSTPGPTRRRRPAPPRRS
jgi:hypothetical protein